jgi:uncharacterized protein (DUF58 family)
MELPQWIKHRVRRKPQVYLLPTIEGLWWLATIALLMIMGWGYTNNICLAIGMILAALTVVLLMETHFNLDGLTIDRLRIEDQYLGQSSLVHIRWKAKKKRDRNKIILSWDGKGPSGLPHSHSAKFYGDITTEWIFPTRGLWQQKHVILSSRYPLGLFRAWSYHAVPVEGWVYPKPKAGALTKMSGSDGEGEARLIESSAGDEPGDVRRYQEGDSPTRVAWKVLARGLGAHTKTFLTESQEVHVYQWPSGLADEELRSRLCFAIKGHYLKQERWGLTVHSDNLGINFGKDHLQKCLRALTVTE